MLNKYFCLLLFTLAAESLAGDNFAKNHPWNVILGVDNNARNAQSFRQ